MQKQLITLFRKDLMIDYRQFSGLGGVFLYVFASFFIVFISFGTIGGQAWVTLFWIVVLFGSVNAVLKSFAQEEDNRRLYYYTLVDPVHVLLSKLVYNSMTVLLITILSLLLFSLLTEYPVVSNRFFALGLVLGSVGIAANFTFVSAIANHTRYKSTLMMILSLPVIIPLLLPLVKLSVKCLTPVTWTMVSNDFLMLGAIDILMIGLSLILFPFLWRG